MNWPFCHDNNPEILCFILVSLAQHFSVLHPVGEVDLSVLVHVSYAEDPLDDEVLPLVAFLKFLLSRQRNHFLFLRGGQRIWSEVA